MIVRRIMIGLAAARLMLPTAALATHDTFCGGNRGAPDIHISVNGDGEVTGSEFGPFYPAMRHGRSLSWSVSGNGYTKLIVKGYRGKATRPVASLILRVRWQTRHDSGELVGTLIYDRRKYWVSCGEFG